MQRAGGTEISARGRAGGSEAVVLEIPAKESIEQALKNEGVRVVGGVLALTPTPLMAGVHGRKM